MEHLMFPRVQLGKKERYCSFAVSPLIQVEIYMMLREGQPPSGLDEMAKPTA